MNVVVAPAELPFAPRPYAAELLSSWLLRVAAANLVSLRELLDGFEERYGRVLSNIPIDYAVPEAAISALAQSCSTDRFLQLRPQDTQHSGDPDRALGQPRHIPVKTAPSFQGTSKTAILCYTSLVLLSEPSPVNSSILGAPRLNLNLGTL
jgi:TniQ